ncbi:hypothetical protein [Streptomyces sp. NPDC006552]|uniref:hypothetical protein n=1 Tax=Streptomyces sp. NPDC006552 TaxID=3157179 RepID=UPI0033BA0FC4
MAWDEWDQLKTDAAERQSAQMRLNQADGGGGTPPLPGKTGDLGYAAASSYMERVGSDLVTDL